MEPAFQQLKARFQSLGSQPSPDVCSQSKQWLQDWLQVHSSTLAAKKPEAEFNGTLMQYFHWYLPGDGTHWQQLRENAQALAQVGISALWLPPACKAFGGIDNVGYASYDLYDLGEFEQQGTVRTKYGTKDEYVAAIKTCQELGLNIYADVVFNHKMGADEQEEFDATPVDPNHRFSALGEPRKIKAWTKFTFPGRGKQYSPMEWHWHHFDGVDHNCNDPDFKAVWLIQNKQFDTNVDLEWGNYDYLMGCDLDIDHDEVRADLKRWGQWILDTLRVDGFRLDAIKHIDGNFFNDWLDHLEAYAERDLFCVGEYWTYDLGTLAWYAGNSGGRLNLFDAPLHLNFHKASRNGSSYDLRQILDGTLMKEMPLLAVTLVENHDTQPLQSLECVVEAWFKPLAYAFILLRAEGYPCIFYADYYGAHYVDQGRDGNHHEIWLASHQWMIDRLLFARQHFAYGPQYNYLDHPNTIGWTRLGSDQHPYALAVLLSNGGDGTKWMEVGKPHTVFYDITSHVTDPICTNDCGWAEFRCPGGSVSVWVEENPLLRLLNLPMGS